MATQVNQTFDSYDSNSNREVFSDIISNLTPYETPLFSNSGDQNVKGVDPMWQTDTLATPDTDNAHLEGEVYTFETVEATDRVKNYTQIFSKRFIVSATQEVVDKAGKTSDVAYEKVKKGREIKIDMEVAMLSNQASVAGSSSVARRLGGLRAWIATNDLMGTGGASGGYNSGTGAVDAATNGTQRTWTKAIMDSQIQAAYVSGGNPDMLMVSPYLKQTFSTFMSDANVAQQRMAASKSAQVTIVGAADTYLSDYGTIEVVPNRQMVRSSGLARNAFLIETDKVKKGWLRKIGEDKEVAHTSDGIPVVMNGEMTLMVMNEAALSVGADLYGLTASS